MSRKLLPRVLVLDEEIPLPANTGKRIRTYNLLRRLARSFRIDLLVHSNGMSDARPDALRPDGIQVYVAGSRVPQKRGARFYAGVLGNLLSTLPYSVSSHRHRKYRDLLSNLLDANDYDLVHCEWTPYAIYRSQAPVPWFVSAHNIESEVWARLADSQSFAPMRAFLGLQARRMERFERCVFSRVPGASAVSERDARRIADWGCPDVEVVPNGVDLCDYSVLSEDRMESGHLVFVGSMDWRANQDGIQWYLNEVHPLLQSLPHYRITIVGRNPPASLLEKAKHDERITVTGEVADVRPYLASASIVVVPLRVGGGSRLKILEAFACGRPVISTTIGAEGLEVDVGRHLLTADTPADFAEAVRGLTVNRHLSRALVHAARARVQERYDWDPISNLQLDAWSRAISRSHI